MDFVVFVNKPLFFKLIFPSFFKNLKRNKNGKALCRDANAVTHRAPDCLVDFRTYA